MKKLISLVLAVVMLLTLLSACNTGTEANNAPVQESTKLDELQKIYADIKPLAEETTIRFIGTIGLQLSAPIWTAYSTGALKAAGINLEFTPASTGPLSVEALTAGEVDLVGTGIGGIAVAAIQGTGVVLSYINNESAGQKFYVKKDDPLASAAVNEHGFHGTADDWRGAEIYMPAGTTLQYLMGTALGDIGLTLQDVTPVYMDANNVNTAMYAEKGEVWGIWNFLCYSADVEKYGYFPVIEGHEVGIDLMTAYVTNNTVLSDPAKRAAIEKIMEFHFATVDWMTASEENMAEVAQIMTDWAQSEGSTTTYDEMYLYLLDTSYITYEDNYAQWTEEVENKNGTMVKALDRLQGIMDFYIEQGNYTEDDRTIMIQNQKDIFITDAMDAIK